jgi:hypothetical protein
MLVLSFEEGDDEKVLRESKRRLQTGKVSTGR